MLAVYCFAQETEETDGDPMEASLEAEPSADIGDPEPDGGSSFDKCVHGGDSELDSTGKDKSSDENSAGPGVNEDNEVKLDPDSDIKDNSITQQGEEPCVSNKLRISTADDLDEMMDIGTVDQVEQEAQMKEEESYCGMDEESSRSSGVPNRGKINL